MQSIKKHKHELVTYDDIYDVAFEDENEVYCINNNKSKNISKIEQTSDCAKCHMKNVMIENVVDGTIVCKNCGLITFVDIIDHRQEWKGYEDDCKNNMYKYGSINESQYHSIGYDNEYTGLIKKLHRWTSISSDEKSINLVLHKIHEICVAGNINKCIEDDAKIMYRSINDYKCNGKKKIMRSRNRSGTIAGGILHACKRKGEPRSPKEIALYAKLKYSDVTKGYKTFLILLKLIDINMIFDVHALNTVEHYVQRFCSELKINKINTNFAINIAKNIRKLDIISDHIPSSIAAGSILLMANIKKISITKKQLDSKFNISVVTISKTFKEIMTKKIFKNIYLKDVIVDDKLTDYFFNLSIIENENYANMELKKETNDNKSNFYYDSDSNDDFILDDMNKKNKQLNKNMEIILSIIELLKKRTMDMVNTTSLTYFFIVMSDFTNYKINKTNRFAFTNFNLKK